MFNRVIEFIRSLYPGKDRIPLHEPRFVGREKEYLSMVIDSTFVSYIGEFVNLFEKKICEITGTSFAVATVNGTAALHVALKLADVQPGDEVITQPLSFVATANAITYCGAKPLFLDVDYDTMGLSPEALEDFLSKSTRIENRACYNNITGRRIKACVPMHTFGHPCRIDQIGEVCDQNHIVLVEDAAESLGSTYKGQHTGTFGLLGILSFNGNKTVTCGGGGVIMTNNEKLAKQAKHITSTAKLPHPFAYIHDIIGYNYRLPNLNAALACAQLEQLSGFLENKRDLARRYQKFFATVGLPFVREPSQAQSNYWLNTIILPDRKARDEFLEETNAAGIMTRPAWHLLPKLGIYQDCQTDGLENARWLEDRLVNIPSSVRL